MPVELTEEEAQVARRAILIVQSLNGNPEARAHLQRGLKVLDPQVETGEDVANKLTAPLQARIEEMEKREKDRLEADEKATKERVEAEALGRMESSFSRLRGQGLTAEGEEKVKTIMKERDIFDPEAAFALFERQNPKPALEQSSWTPDHWNYAQDAVVDTKALFTDSEKWADDQVGQVLLDERRRNGDDS